MSAYDYEILLEQVENEYKRGTITEKEYLQRWHELDMQFTSQLA